MMDILDSYWSYEFGHAVVTTTLSGKEIRFYATLHRHERNPFQVSFPFLVKHTETAIHISVPETAFIDPMAQMLSQVEIEPISIAKTIRAHFFPEAGIIEVQRYLDIYEHVQLETFPYLILDTMQIENINRVSSLDLKTLTQLNETEKLFALYEGSKIFAYGTVTREEVPWIEISIATVKEYRQKGYGTELAKRMVDCCRAHGKHVIYVCSTGNVPSDKIAQKLHLFPLGKELIGYLKVN